MEWMKWSRFKHALAASAVLGWGMVYGQSDATMHWSKTMSDPQVSLSENRSQFEDHFSSQERGRSRGIKPFERWMWWAEKHQDDGAKPHPDAWWEASASRRNALAVANNAEPWQLVGPDEVPIHGGAGRINRIRISNNAWHACAPAGGLWISEDEGQTWSVRGADALAPLGATDVWVDPFNDAHLWLATGDGNGADTYSIGVLESWDGGMTWIPLELAFEPDQSRRIHALEPHPSGNGHMWVATDIGLFQTLNGGATFSLVLPGQARDLTWLSHNVAVVALEGDGLMRTVDGGATWETVLAGTPGITGRIQLAAELFNDTLYAVAGHAFQQNFLGFWQSTDAGATWTQTISNLTGPNLLGYTVSGADNAGQAFWDLCMALDPAESNHVLVGGVNVWETWDGGLTWNCPVHWQGADVAKYAHADQHDIRFLDNGDVLLCNDGGVFRWDGEETVDLSDGLSIAQGYHVALDPTKAGTWLAGTQDNGTILSRPGLTHRILDGDGFQCFFDSSTTDRLYAAAYYGLLYRSDDGGRTMTSIANYFASSGPNELGAWETPFGLSPSTPGRIVTAKKSLHLSDDGGESWTTVGGMGTVRSTAMAMSASTPDAYLVAKNGALYWKDPASSAFSEVNGLPGTQIGDVCMHPSLPGVWWVCFEGYDSNQLVWRTEDAGATWQSMESGLPALPMHSLLHASNGDLYVASDLGVHRWNEGAWSWEDVGTSLPLTPVVSLQEDPHSHWLYASTYGRGVWRLLLPDRPATDAAIVDLHHAETQCLLTLSGNPVVVNTGTEDLAFLECQVVASGFSTVSSHTWTTHFDPPLEPGQQATLDAYSLDVLEPGKHGLHVSLNGLSDESTAIGWLDSQWASGLGATLTLEWWGDCENADMSWVVNRTDAPTETNVAVSVPQPAGDTTFTTMCLSQGCHQLVWTDKGNDGFSGNDCGESGGFRVLNSFDEILLEGDGIDFGTTLTETFCLPLYWCFADYNGDGMRGVEDVLALLSSYGCNAFCDTDNNGDGTVGVGDLMNMLSVYGSDCY